MATTTATDPNAPVTPPAQASVPRQFRPPTGMPTRAAHPLAATAPTQAPMALSSIPGVSVTPTNPANDLRGQTLAPGPTADRYAVAQQQFQNSADASAPEYTKALNDATSFAASRGQLGSGQLRTSYGDLANQRNQQLQTSQNQFLTDALNNSIQDTYNNVGIAQQQQQFQSGLQNQTFGQNLATQQVANQQYNDQFNQSLAGTALANQTQAQGFNQNVASQQLAAALQNQQYNQGLSTQQFQSGQQNQTFNQGLASQQLGAAIQGQQFGQGVTSSQLQDQLTNSSANRSLQQLLAGQSGNPSDVQLALAQLFGGQATQSANSLAGLIGNTSANTAAQNQTSSLQALLQALGIGGTAQPTPPISAPSYVPAIPDAALGY